jgi:hypothetical protein
VVAEDPAALEDGRLEGLAASLGVTVGDVRRMVELAPRRTYRGRFDVDEIRRRYEAGESLTAIGALMSASDTTVRHAMIRAGIPTGPGPVRRGSDMVRCIGSTLRRSGGVLRPVIRSLRSPCAIGASQGGMRLAVDREGMDRPRKRHPLGAFPKSRPATPSYWSVYGDYVALEWLAGQRKTVNNPT